MGSHESGSEGKGRGEGLERPKVYLIGGGARSGKSTFAVALAQKLGERRAFLATARPYDDDLRQRIVRHQEERGTAFRTVEEPVALAEVLERLRDVDVVVIDCLTLWISNLLLDGLSPAQVEERIEELARVLRDRPFHVVLVSNEVGMGIHPETSLGRTFRDLAGRAHQRLARVADELHFAVLGVILRLRPEPVRVQPPGEPS